MKKTIRRILNKFGIDVKYYTAKHPLLYFLKEHDIKTVIDVGANVGQFSLMVREVLPDVQIYAFEPLSETYKKLTDVFKNDNNYHIYNVALGSKKVKVGMNKNEYSPSSSLLENTSLNDSLFPHTKVTSKELISVTKLDDIDIKIVNNLLLKLDVQGYEMEVLKGGLKTLRQAKIIIIELSFVEIYKSQPLFDDIYQFLKSESFSYEGSLQNKFDPKTNAILFEDAVFIKTINS